MASDKTSASTTPMRVAVQKTYKMYINGAFPRTESGRYYPLKDQNDKILANVCLASKKDFKNAVVAADKAQEAWSARSAYNKSQIIYRMAEMLEIRKSQFMEEMLLMGLDKARAANDVDEAIDRLVYFAGWCDKYQQVYSSVNPVSSSHFNFSLQEPMGVVAQIAPDNSPLLGLVQTFIPAIAGGNTSVILASETYPLSAVSFAEVLATSDLPAGVVNILTGTKSELLGVMASHQNVKALAVWDADPEEAREAAKAAAQNVKRLRFYTTDKLADPSPQHIIDLQETKTTWHPIENIGGSSSSY